MQVYHDDVDDDDGDDDDDDDDEMNVSGQFSRNNFHFFCHILSYIAETSKHLAKRNIGQFNHTL